MKPSWKRKNAVRKVLSLSNRVDEPPRQAPLARPEHQPEAEEPEQRRRDEEVREVLDRDVDRVLRANQAALERREADLHQEHQRRADQQPTDVYGLYAHGER